MSVTLIIPTYLQAYADDLETTEVSGNTVGDCLDNLINKFPGINKMLFNEDGKLHSYVGIYINGEDASSGGLSGLLKDGDKVHVTYVIGGG